jgi:acyl carrier protein
MAGGEPRMKVRDRILGFVQEELLPPGTSIEPGDDLLSGGLLDSISVLRLATFVSEEFEFEIAPADFVVENFQSVEVLTSFVLRASGHGSSLL